MGMIPIRWRSSKISKTWASKTTSDADDKIMLIVARNDRFHLAKADT